MKPNFSETKMYTYLKGYFMGSNMRESIQALNFARLKHEGQKRKGGEPYIIHPLTMACNAIAVGINDDSILSAILLHDILEDCGVKANELPVSDKIKSIVNLVTFVEGDDLKYYYQCIGNCKEAIIVKLLDRCHNVSSMAGVFTKEKIRNYIDETKDYVIPLIRKGKDKFPECSNELFVLKYHMYSVIDAIETTMNVYNE